MDSAENDITYDMLDLLAYKCNDLTGQLRETSQADEQDKILHEFLEKVDKEFQPIDEIREGLFNGNSHMHLRRLCHFVIIISIFFGSFKGLIGSM